MKTGLHRMAALAAFFSLAAGSAGAQQKLTEVKFGTNWVAQAEHGGYYQAVADGTYEKYGLKVTIVPGGPQANNRMLLPVGRIDFYMGGNMIQAFSAVEENIPTLVVAAHFQKDPQIFLSHPGQGYGHVSGPEEVERHPAREGECLATFFQWMKVEFGFKDEQVKPYTFNPAPFLANKKAVQQGYVTSEPLAVEKAGGFKPNIFLLADNGFSTYATTVETRREIVEKQPGRRAALRRCIGDRLVQLIFTETTRPANALIKKDNPEMSDEQIAFSIAKLKEYGIVDSGDADQARHRRHDGCADEGFLRQDGQGGRSSRPGSTTRSPTRCNSSTRASASN